MCHQRCVGAVTATELAERVGILAATCRELDGEAGKARIDRVTLGVDDARVWECKMDETRETEITRHLVGDADCPRRERTDGSRTAKSIAIGISLRASDVPAEKWYSAMCCILARSTIARAEAGCEVIEAFDEATQQPTQLALFPAERAVPVHAKSYGVQVRLNEMQLHRPRQWGACSLACVLYEQVGLDKFWASRLPNSREGTCWRHILQTLVCYRLIDPASEWRLHRSWFAQSAIGDLLGQDYALVEKNALYRCLDKLLGYKTELFSHLRERWRDLFAARFDVLLYDLTSTYFESDLPPMQRTSAGMATAATSAMTAANVIALVVTPEGFPLRV